MFDLLSKKTDHLAYFMKDEIITPVESAFVADHNDTLSFKSALPFRSYLWLNVISVFKFILILCGVSNVQKYWPAA